MERPSKILIIGGTGHVGKHLAKASLALHHPTYLLVRPAPATTFNVQNSNVIEALVALGAEILHGSLQDYESLLDAVRRVDVVISAVGHTGSQLADQMQLIAAIQEAGNIKRFLPSEFGVDVDRELNELMLIKLGAKRKIRRAVEEAGIPHTFVSCNNLFDHFLVNLVQRGLSSPPRDKVVIYGDGNVKAVYVAEEDVGMYTIKAVEDTRTLNKTMYIRPYANILSMTELVRLWEQKIGRTLEKQFQSEDEILKQMKEAPFPENLYPAFRHAIYVRGVEVFEMGPDAVEATELFPEVKYRTADEYFQQFV